MKVFPGKAWAPSCLVCVLGLTLAADALQPARPQDDLNQFANADWMARTPLPADRVSISASTELIDQVEEDLRRLIEDLAADEAAMRRDDVQQIVNFYRSMMDQAEVERRGMTPVADDLARIDGIASARDMAAVAGYLSSIAAGGPFDAVVSVDAADPSIPIVRVRQGGTMLPDRAYYLDPAPASVRIREQYVEYLASLFRAAGRPSAEESAAAVVALEVRLAAAQAEAGQQGDQGQAYPFLRLQRAFPGFDWQAWAEPQGIHRAGAVVMAPASCFQAFAALVPQVPLSTWRAWLAARYLTAMSPFLPSKVALTRFEFFGRILTGQTGVRPTWKRGVSLVNDFLGDSIGRRYVERHFQPRARDQARAIAREIVAAYRDAVRDASWMPAAARAAAQQRLATVAIKVGYPDRWRSYAGLEIKPDDLMGNIRRARVFDNRYRMTRLSEPGNSGQWLMTPQTVNAYYAPVAHEIVVLAGILQPPYFTAGGDDAANYGAIGAVIGHEVSHALDLSALPGAPALVAQLDTYEPLPGVRANGVLARAETLADLSGLAIAHRAYRRSLGNAPAPVIDGMSGDQRVFLGWARIWRQQVRPEFVRYQIGTSAYPPWEFRVNGLVQHLDAFHDAFGVAPGDRLYRTPADRVRVW
jgi:putative endopeptidase